VIVYSEPNAAKVRHVRAHSRVSLNLDSGGNGSGIVVGGVASVDAEGADPLVDEQYLAKYSEYASLGFSKDFLAAYNTRLKIAAAKVWTTPTGADVSARVGPTRKLGMARGCISAACRGRVCSRSTEVAALRSDGHGKLAHPVGDDGDRTGGVLHLTADQ
jgi:hypothetical protein